MDPAIRRSSSNLGLGSGRRSSARSTGNDIESTLEKLARDLADARLDAGQLGDLALPLDEPIEKRLPDPDSELNILRFLSDHVPFS